MNIRLHIKSKKLLAILAIVLVQHDHPLCCYEISI